MSRSVELPAEHEVRAAPREIIDQARQTGHRPNVLAVARRFGLSNTTFRRNFPDVARELGDQRRTPPTAVESSAAAAREDTLRKRHVTLFREKETCVSIWNWPRRTSWAWPWRTISYGENWKPPARSPDQRPARRTRPTRLSRLAPGSRPALPGVTASLTSMNTDNTGGDEPPDTSDSLSGPRKSTRTSSNAFLIKG